MWDNQSRFYYLFHLYIFTHHNCFKTATMETSKIISHVQYLHDINGKPTAVQIPFNDWKTIEKTIFKISDTEIPEWQKNIVRTRIKNAKENPDSMLEWEKIKNTF